MKSLKEEKIFEEQNDRMKSALENFFNNVLDCIVTDSFKYAK